MKLVAGTLYFISEVDVLTGQKFDYYKIGLVKDSRQGDSFDRAGEHQTGNPRRLEVRYTVNTPAINDLETLMHDLYATERIFGEWFVLPGNSVKKAVAKAEELAAQQNSLVKSATAAAKYADVASNDKIIAATPAAKSLYLELQQAKLEQKEIKTVFALEKTFFEGLTGAKFDTTLFFTTTSKMQTQLLEDKLAAKHPKIYLEFVREVMTMTPSFTSPATRDPALTLPKKLATAISEQIARLEKAGRRPSLETAQEIHFNHLVLLSSIGDASWREDSAGTQLKSMIKANGGIESVSKWSRTPKTTKKFVARDFKQAYPDLAEEFTMRTPSSSSAIVDMRSYMMATK
jgi:hypothetical protein